MIQMPISKLLQLRRQSDASPISVASHCQTLSKEADTTETPLSAPLHTMELPTTAISVLPQLDGKGLFRSDSMNPRAGGDPSDVVVSDDLARDSGFSVSSYAMIRAVKPLSLVSSALRYSRNDGVFGAVSPPLAPSVSSISRAYYVPVDAPWPTLRQDAWGRLQTMVEQSSWTAPRRRELLDGFQLLLDLLKRYR